MRSGFECILTFCSRYGDELGRLKVAEELLKKALEGSKKGVAPAVISDAKVCTNI